MRVHSLSVLLMAVMAFALSTALEPSFQNWEGHRAGSDDLLQRALGDGRKLFAKHFYTKADVYFHNGYYPTIYDNAADFKKTCQPGEMQGGAEDEREDFLGKPTDWIDAFGRHFFPARHTHLGDSGCGHSCCQRRKSDAAGATGAHAHEHEHEHDADCQHDHSGDEEAAPGTEREILPWLRLSAQLDPQRVETYVVASYWLRSKLGKVDEAEQFLREGLQANPGDYEILFELGRIYYEHRQNADRARHVWELALQRWREREAGKPEPALFAYSSILNYLAKLEREQNNYPKAIQYYTALKEVSPNQASIEAWIVYLKTNGPPIRVGLTEGPRGSK